jgi:hypothetical protein
MPSNPSDQNIFRIFSYEFTPPGAGINFSYPVFQSSRVQLIGFSFTLATDATVANRYVSLYTFNGTLATMYSGISEPQPASTTYDYHAAIGIPRLLIAPINRSQFALPDFMFAENNYEISSVIYNIQATDTYTNLILTFKQWLGNPTI